MKRFFFVYAALCGLCSLSMAQTPAPKGAVASPEAAETAVYDTIRTTYEDGTLSRVYTVLHGTETREGVSISYHPNGKVAVEAPYKAGKLDGVFRSYYANGQVWQTIGYRDGIEEGITTTYFENGVKKSREIYKYGALEGVVEEWDASGNLRRKLPYVGGQLHGVAKVFDAQGALKEEMTMVHGMRHGPYRRYNRGIKVLDAEFERNHCVKNCEF